MSNHAGAAGVYAALPLKADMIGMYAAVANANHMPLAGGAEPLLGTNPLAIAIPAGQEPPLVLDMATSIVSYGTIKNYRLQGKPLPEGWMVDPKTGAAVTDPRKDRRGAAAADGRLQGRGSGADDRPACRHAQRRAVRPRLRRFQRRAGEGQQHRAIRARARSGALPEDRARSRPRSTATPANCAPPRRCPARACGCRATSAPSAAPTG